jgi:porphobilinogen synthase
MFRRFRYRRINAGIRERYQETFLKIEDFIWPLFLVAKDDYKQEINSMPGVFHWGIKTLIRELPFYIEQGLKAVLLFGVPETKGIEQAWKSDGLVQQGVAKLKTHFPDLEVITDVCICSFTPDGHCHIGENDATCEILAKIALSHALAGADAVAPSDMMDGRVYYIHRTLRERELNKVNIISYAVKYASSFYGPFREAAACTPQQGDRKTYQMDPPNALEALEEIEADIEEGASSVIIKPALAYLDIIHRAKEQFTVPLIAYNVSGEYMLVNQMIATGLAREDIRWETLMAFKRAGADRIISYHTPYLLTNYAKTGQVR